MKDFEKFKCKDLCILHLNVSSLRKNILEIDGILRSKIFDIVQIRSQKINVNVRNEIVF
jgi:hypothetical protein